MSAITTIRQGIVESSWSLVCQGFEQLTGEKLAPPSDNFGSQAQEILGEIDRLLGNLRAMRSTAPTTAASNLVDEQPARPPDSDIAPNTDEFAIKHAGTPRNDGERTARAEPLDIKTHTNSWVDNLDTEMQAAEESKKLSALFQKKTRRETFEGINAACGDCGRREKVHPDLIPRRCDPGDDLPVYRCNDCIVKKTGGSSYV